MDSRFLECSSPAGFERFECLRSAPVVAVERPPDVLRRLVLSIRCEKEEISDGYLLFFACSSPAGLERFECLRSAPVVAGERPPDVLRRLVLSSKKWEPLTVKGFPLFCVFWNDYN